MFVALPNISIGYDYFEFTRVTAAQNYCNDVQQVKKVVDRL